MRAHWIEQLYVEKLGGTNLNANTNFPPMAMAGNTNPLPVPAVMKTNPPAQANIASTGVKRVYYSVELVKGATLLERRLPPVEVAAPAASVVPPAPVATTNQPPVVSLPPDAEALLLATYPVTDADLETLAAARAQAVQTYLLQSGKVEAARLFLKSASAGGLRQTAAGCICNSVDAPRCGNFKSQISNIKEIPSSKPQKVNLAAVTSRW